MPKTIEFADRIINFWIPGIPAPGGSKRFVGFGKRTGRAILIDMGGKRNKNWRSIVAAVAHNHKPETPLTGPLSVSMTFYLQRPKRHFHTSRKHMGQIKEDAPKYHTSMPDALKLARSTEDSLTGIIWKDDAQTAELKITKFYGVKTGAQITVVAI